MSLLQLTCDTLKKNLGAVRCGELPEMPKIILTTPDDFSFAVADFATFASLKTAMQNAMTAGIDVRIYLWPNFVNYEGANEEAQYQETPLADLLVRNGKYRFRGHIRKNMCQHKAMFTHSANSGRVFVIDIKNNMLATVDEESGRVYGLSMNLLNVEKLMISNGTDATVTPVYVVLSDSNEIDQNGILIPVPFINTLKRLTDVTITGDDAATINAAIVTVKTECDSIPVLGLALADFLAEDPAGDPIVITARTDHGDGTYTLTTTADWVDGALVYLTTPALLSIKAYEYVEAAEITVA